MGYRFMRLTAAMTLLGLLGACSPDHGDTSVATAATGHPTTAVGPPTAPSGQPGQELAFVACMRQHGVANMPDPAPGDTSGRSAVKTALDELGLGNDATFQAALDACSGLLPALPAPTPPSNQQLAIEIKFAQCMRDHGVPTFQDPDPDGSWAGSWLNANDKSAVAAAAACDHYLDALSPSPSPAG